MFVKYKDTENVKGWKRHNSQIIAKLIPELLYHCETK